MMEMDVRWYSHAKEFLNAAGEMLERNEAANGLVLGVCGQLIRHPERFRHPVCLITMAEGGAVALAAIMTPPHKLILAGTPRDAEAAAAELVRAVKATSWNIPGMFGPKFVAHPVVVRLASAAGKDHRVEQNLRMYELTSVRLPPPSRGRMRTAETSDLERVARWFCEARLEMFGKADPEESRRAARTRVGDGDLFLWVDGEPVSMACKTRPTKRGISVGMVFTPPARRRRGYATALVAELSRRLLAEGRSFCTLYADLANPASNSIYRNIGYRPIGDLVDYELIEKV
jgi:predicted GNAT family acetyltransferase